MLLIGAVIVVGILAGMLEKEPEQKPSEDAQTQSQMNGSSETESETESSPIIEGLIGIDFTADVTHDGKDDVIRVIGDETVAGDVKYSIHVYSEGNKIFSEDADPGNTAYYLVEQDDGAYLLKYSYTNTVKVISCGYGMFYVSNFGQKFWEDQSSITTFYAHIEETDKEEWLQYATTVNAYFEDAYLLMGMQDQELLLGNKETPVTYLEKFQWLFDEPIDMEKSLEDIFDEFLVYAREKYPIPEKILYETTADVTHDGTADLIQSIQFSYSYEFDWQNANDYAYVKVFRGVGNGEYEKEACYISDTCSYVLPMSIGLTKSGNKEYLMEAVFDESSGSTEYYYQVFSIDKDGNAVIKAQNNISFIVSPYMQSWLTTPNREDVVPAFHQEMQPWIENGNILVASDVNGNMYLGTEEELCPACIYYDEIWERNDFYEIEMFTYEFGGVEDWRVFLYHYNDAHALFIPWIDSVLEAHLGNWYADYNGKTMHRISPSEENKEEDGIIANNSDIIYYDAKAGEDVQEVLYKMIEAMIIPRMTPSDLRSYTITDYAIEEQEVIPVSEHMWLIKYLNGYYSYEGIDGMLTMEEALDLQTMDDGVAREDGLVEFYRGGSEGVGMYLLMEKDGVYRLERLSNMVGESFHVRPSGDIEIE